MEYTVEAPWSNRGWMSPLFGTIVSRAARPPYPYDRYVVQRTWMLCMAAIVFVAILIRGATLALRPDAAIDMDGTEYVRVAQTLLDGHGAIGMRGRPTVVSPPLYSWTIALL